MDSCQYPLVPRNNSPLHLRNDSGAEFDMDPLRSNLLKRQKLVLGIQKWTRSFPNFFVDHTDYMGA